MSYAYIPDTVWADLNAVAAGDPYVHAIAVYQWTCQHKRATGIYYLPVEYVMTDLRYSREDVTRVLRRLDEASWSRWDEHSSWVFVRDYAAHNLKGTAPGGAFYKNDNRVKAIRDQLAEAQHRAARLAAEWWVLYDHLLSYEPAHRKIASVGSRIQSDRGDQTVPRGVALPFQGEGGYPSKGIPPSFGDPHQGTGTTGTTDRTAAGAAHLPVDPVENRTDGSEIQSVRSVGYQPAPNEHAPSWHARERELGVADAGALVEGDPPSPSTQAGLPLPLAPVAVERTYRRGRTPDELAREPTADHNISLLRMWAYEAFDAKWPDGFPAQGLSWDDVGDIAETVRLRAAPLRVEYQRVRDAVEHAIRMRQKGVGGPGWRKPT